MASMFGDVPYSKVGVEAKVPLTIKLRYTMRHNYYLAKQLRN
jgi:hypothetical protein